MTDFRTAGSIGERIQAARKARGMSARELAEAIGGVPSQSTIENIELGRKASIDVVQLLNIAMALRVPVVYLLAPMGIPDGDLDMTGLSQDFQAMSPSEFDAWLSAVGGARLPSSLEERNAVTELQALRELNANTSEIARIESRLHLELTSDLHDHGPGAVIPLQEQLQRAQRDVERLKAFLRSAGWAM